MYMNSKLAVSEFVVKVVFGQILVNFIEILLFFSVICLRRPRVLDVQKCGSYTITYSTDIKRN